MAEEIPQWLKVYTAVQRTQVLFLTPILAPGDLIHVASKSTCIHMHIPLAQLKATKALEIFFN